MIYKSLRIGVLVVWVVSGLVMPSALSAAPPTPEAEVLPLEEDLAPAEVSATSLDYIVQVSATVQASPPRITLNWPADATATRYTIHRKSLGDTTWGPGIDLPGTATSYTDTNVTVGTGYEYKIAEWADVYAEGYIYSGIDVPLIEDRGSVILIVDSIFATPLAFEIARLEQDLVGDGWHVIRHDVSRYASVPAVKALIQSDYANDPDGVEAVFLLGHVPVPYSGWIFPDGHSDHAGAWPADVFYGDMDGEWTDTTVNTTSAARPENHNVPGDGKYDQDYVPLYSELQVGRVDFEDMTLYGMTETELMRQYLNKDHAFRHGLLPLPRRGLVDGYLNWESRGYAENGWRNFSAMFGTQNVVAADWFTTLPTQGYLWAYGCGPGWYQGAVGIGDSEDFGTQDPKVVFTMLLGSYFGDWDSSNNFLRAPLASPTYGLVSVWAGLPNWYAHPMALGETIGYITRQTQNDNTVYNDYINVGYVHIALMGDPTLRMHPVIPPTNLTASAGSGAVTLNWASSPDTVLGYHVYRSTTPEGPYTRITATPVTGTSYTNLGLSPGEYTYMVRAVKRETSGSGTYINLSQGGFLTVTVTAPATFDVGLVPGWNLVSFPSHPDQPAPADVLGAIEGYYDVVYTYNGCDTADPWAQYVPGAPAYANDLTAMDETQGFWIDVSTATTLQVGGAVPEASSIPLCAGWNMVGYPALTAQPPADALASLASGGCVRVYAYNPTNATDPWKMYNSCAPAYTNDLAQMEPGWGYWMYVEQAGTWSVP